MKKLLLSTLLLFSITSLSGCSSNQKERLTYGTLYHEEAISLDTDTLYNKKEKENFILATYEKGTTCGCWTQFSLVLNHLAKYDHILTYKMTTDQIDERLKEFGIKESQDPAFYIIANKKIIRSTFYADNDSYFTDETKFLNTVKETINLPYMYFIDEGQIQSEVIDKGGILYYTRMTCPDCSYCTPNVLMPYLKDKQSNNKIYVFDMDPIRNKGSNIYQEFKDDHLLSNKNNPGFGYNTGYVPTFQYYKGGLLTDMAVYFNDTITDGVITTSYYDEERASHLHYLDKLNKKVLTGTKLSSDELNGSGNWKDNDTHNKYYEPFLKAFLDTYFK